jgi:predicted permease
VSWRRFLRRARWDDERRRELETYIEIETDENVARGMAPGAARAAAYRKLGNPTLVREEIYRMNTATFVETLWQDVRYGFRTLRASPTFTTAALLSLTLGIGANTAIFQLLNAVRLRPLPVARAHEIVEVRVDPQSAPNGRTGAFFGARPMMSWPVFDRVRREQRVLESAFAWGSAAFDLSTGGESRVVPGLWASGELFQALELTPAAGRLLTAADDSACASRAVVVSHDFWQREYGAAADAVGRTLHLDGEPFQIAGVAPAGFFGIEVGRRFDVAAPLCAIAVLRPRVDALRRGDVWWLSVMGRLKRDITVEAATAQLASIAPGIFASTLPSRYNASDAKNYVGFRLAAFPAGTGVSALRSTYAQPLWVLLTIAGFVLLIASANLANLLLARASARERELAVRLAIGASRARLLRQLLVESLMLAAAGAVLGAGVARALSGALVRGLSRDSASAFLNLSMDWRLLAFTAGLSVITALIFGLAPAVRATRTPPGAAMKIGARVTGANGFGIRRALTIGQVALSFTLVTAAVLFARTLGNLANVDAGFRADGVLVANFDHRRAGIEPDRLLIVQQDFLRRLEHLPGVQTIASVSIVPISGSGWNQSITVDGARHQDPSNINRVGPRYFETMGMPLLAGRTFDARDVDGAPAVAIVSRSFAEKYFQAPAPLGRAFYFDQNVGEPPFTVVGVVADSKYGDLREDAGPIVYLADTQEPEPVPDLSIVARAARPDVDLRAAFTAAARELHAGTLVSYQRLTETIDRSLVRERLMAMLSGFFGALAGILAAVGLYGVMSYVVARRRGEFGVRLALGAQPSTVMRMVLGEAGIVAGAGVAVGIGLAVLAGGWAETLLFGLRARDAATYAAAGLAVAAVTGVAAAIPARRAARVSPTIALRQE